MKYNNIKNIAEKIVMPEDMKIRIAENCKKQISQQRKETTMKNNNLFKKPAAVFAALAICLSLSVSAMAASGLLKGFFQDVKRPDGAVIGTTYEQATDEIALKVNVDGNTLMAVAAFTDKAPFIAAEMGIGNYQIVDGNGKVVKDGSYTEHTKIIDGQAEIRIDISDIDNGSYKLIVTSFVAYNKADPPMAVNGDWACNFTK